MTQPGASRVDLDDSRVVAVSRLPGRVVIELEQKRNNKAQRIEVRVAEVSKEIAEHYVGHKVTAPHPDPKLPLDYIEYAEQGPNHIELQGYLKNDSWYLWRIEGNGIEILAASNAEKAT